MEVTCHLKALERQAQNLLHLHNSSVRWNKYCESISSLLQCQWRKEYVQETAQILDKSDAATVAMAYFYTYS